MRFVFLVMVWCLGGTSVLLAQTPNVHEIVTQYLKRTEEYSATFKNLTAEETKDIEDFDLNGKVKKQRHIVSELLVYQPVQGQPPTQNWAAEYRSVRSVDNKPLPDAEKRAVKLFEDIAKAKSGADEWERVRKEWAKYDGEQSWWGFTINQAVAIKESRDYFGFALLRTEEYEGQPCYVVFYRQLAPSPHYTGPTYLTESIRMPPGLRRLPAMFTGKLWIDVATYRLRREERTMVIYPPTLTAFYRTPQELRALLTNPQGNQLQPLTVARWRLQYQPSEFGIFTPKEIEISFNHNYFQQKTETGWGTPELRLGHRTIYRYGAFKRYDVTGEETKREIIKPDF